MIFHELFGLFIFSENVMMFPLVVKKTNFSFFFRFQIGGFRLFFLFVVFVLVFKFLRVTFLGPFFLRFFFLPDFTFFQIFVKNGPGDIREGHEKIRLEISVRLDQFWARELSRRPVS